MSATSFAVSLAGVTVAAALAAPTPPAAARTREPDGLVAARLMTVTRSSAWRRVAAVPLRFPTHHPQGLVRIGDDLFLSAVEVTTSPEPPREPGGRRGPGAGVGHLFRFGMDGALKADLRLGEGAAYHPGGVDFDGRSIWVPVSEYRPDSRALIYRVDPVAMRATLAFRFDDHVGAVAYDRRRGALLGFSWGSRRLYRWRIPARGTADRPPSRRATASRVNRFNYIDYQDCHAVGAARVLCGGLSEQASPDGGARFQLGGLELIDLRNDRPVWQVPVPLRSPTGRVMTQNPVFVEATANGLRAYFVPDDDASTLYVYEIDPPSGGAAGSDRRR